MRVGIFDDGLKDHGRNDCIVNMRIDIHLLLHASGISSVLHGQIHLDELHLVA